MTENFDEDLKNVMREFEELRERIFELGVRHHKYASFLSDDLNEALEESLENEFKAYYTLYAEKLKTIMKIRVNVLKQKQDIIVPHKHRRWWCPWKWKNDNEAADLSDELLALSTPYYHKELAEIINSVNGFAIEEAEEDNAEPPTKETKEPSEDKPEEPSEEAETPAKDNQSAADQSGDVSEEETAGDIEADDPSGDIEAAAPDNVENDKGSEEEASDSEEAVNGTEWEEEGNDPVLDEGGESAASEEHRL